MLFRRNVNCIQFKLTEVVKRLGLVERREITFPSDPEYKSTAEIAFSVDGTYLLPSMSSRSIQSLLAGLYHSVAKGRCHSRMTLEMLVYVY